MSSEQIPMTLPVGYRLEGYVIEGLLGQGGFGVTYVAVEELLGKRVAIKELLPLGIVVRGPQSSVIANSLRGQDDWTWAKRRFLDEARVLARFRCEQVVDVHRYFEANGTAYIVMDYVEGETYEARLRRIGPENSEESLMTIMNPILDGVQAVHAQGLLHRDIKPANILVRDDGRPVLIDFGAARFSVAEASQSLTAIVSHGYSPLEQYSSDSKSVGRIGPWTDIYSVGAVMFRAITGEKPEDSPDRSMGDDNAGLVNRGIEGYSQDFLAAVDWAMALKVKDRPQSLQQWRETMNRGRATSATIVSLRSDERPEQGCAVDQAVPLLAEPEHGVAAQASSAADVVRGSTGSKVLRRIPRWLLVCGSLAIAAAFAAYVARNDPSSSKRQPSYGYEKPPPDISESPSVAEQPEASKETAVPSPTAEMVPVEGGRMPDDLPESLREKFEEDFAEDLQPAVVGDFEIGRYEVTWKEWREVADWASRNGEGDFDLGEGHPADHPVSGLSWLDCVDWCNAKSKKEGLKPVYMFDDSADTGRGGVGSDLSADGYRLPTQLEWMWAAAGGKRSRGCAYSGGSNLDDVGWHEGNSQGKTAAVGSKQANELGLHDMSGNVWEWCEYSDGDPDGSYLCFGGSFKFSPTSLLDWGEEERATKRGDGDAGLRLARGSSPERRSAGLNELRSRDWLASADDYADIDFDYTARISDADLYNSKHHYLPDLPGIRASDILLQERFNFYDGINRDHEDTWDLAVTADPDDGTFSSPAARTRLRELFSGKKVVRLVDPNCDTTGQHGPGCRHADRMSVDEFEEVPADFFRSQPVVKVDAESALGVVIVEQVAEVAPTREYFIGKWEIKTYGREFKDDGTFILFNPDDGTTLAEGTWQLEGDSLVMTENGRGQSRWKIRIVSEDVWEVVTPEENWEAVRIGPKPSANSTGTPEPNQAMIYVGGGKFPGPNTGDSAQLATDGSGIGLKLDPLESTNNGRLCRVPDSEFSGTQVGSFLLSAYEVTWREWSEVTEWAMDNGYPDLAAAGTGHSPDVPVDVENQFDAMKWCNAKSEKEGFSPVYRIDGKIFRDGKIKPDVDAAADGYRLPTGAEWEWAARGGIRSKGFVFSGGNKLDDVGWWRGNSFGAPKDSDGLGRGAWPVGRKTANELGIYDMSGNVWEWCAESIRGGGWAGSDDFCTAGSSMTPETYYDPDDYFPSPGLRVARNAPFGFPSTEKQAVATKGSMREKLVSALMGQDSLDTIWELESFPREVLQREGLAVESNHEEGEFLVINVRLQEPLILHGASTHMVTLSFTEPVPDFGGIVFAKFHGDLKTFAKAMNLKQGPPQSSPPVGDYNRVLEEGPDCPDTIGASPVDENHFYFGWGHCNG